MYERMTDKSQAPELADMTAHCGRAGAWFTELNGWLRDTCGTEQRITFPYGNHYGWGVSHRIKGKLVCNLFAERDGFTVMVRLSDRQYASIYESLDRGTRALIDDRYPCGDGGWIHYRVAGREGLEDIRSILAVKCRR